MAQFRLTKKFATDLKVSKLALPEKTLSVVDDWFIDVIRIKRKKVAVITHAKSLLTFFLPYEEAGGAKSIPNSIRDLLERFMRQSGLNFNKNKLAAVFTSEPYYCKTVNRKILGHMNDFKNGAEVMVMTRHDSFQDVDWVEMSCLINEIPVNVDGYCYPKEKAIELFSSGVIN